MSTHIIICNLALELSAYITNFITIYSVTVSNAFLRDIRCHAITARRTNFPRTFHNLEKLDLFLDFVLFSKENTENKQMQICFKCRKVKVPF